MSARGMNPSPVGGVAATLPEPPSTDTGDLQASAPAVATDPGFGYQGGPIIADPQARASFWGAAWSGANHATRRSNLIKFVQDFLASDYMNILSQYGVGNGAGKCGTWLGVTACPRPLVR